MPENVGYITDLIAYYCYKGHSHTIYIEANWCEIVLVSIEPLEECVFVKSFYCVSW